MFFQRFYDKPLAQASYLIGCQRTGEALVVDPNRDVAQYIAVAEREGLRVSHVTETHIHADFVSGARELAERTGAQLLLSGEGGARWQYDYASAIGATLLSDGDAFKIGNIKLEVLHTPGHSPEHISFLVTDTATATEPWGILTGDFVFVGDVGRPDLLELAAGVVGTMEASAIALFHSLERFRALPDHVQVWPGHGAGSACGKALGAIASSTVGYEKRASWGVAATDPAEFVRMVLDGQPEPPRYFAQMKRINKAGPRLLTSILRPPRLPGNALSTLVDGKDVVVDLRSAAEFAARHVPGTINIPLTEGSSFVTWAGWLLPYDRDIYLLLDDTRGERVELATRELSMIGLDRIAGVLGPDAMVAWQRSGREFATVAQVHPSNAASMLAAGEAAVVDVRGHSEWEAGRLPEAPNVPLGYLTERIDEIPRDRPLIVYCQAGSRSAIAASLLQAQGLTNVVNLTGGYAAWAAAGQPTTSDTGAS